MDDTTIAQLGAVAEQHANEAANPKQAEHGPNILSLPSDMLFTHMAPHVLGDVAELRTTCRAFRTNAAVVVAEAAQSASLHLSKEVSSREADGLGTGLSSALSNCQQPKNLHMSITGDRSPYPALAGIQQSGAHPHVAALHLEKLQPAVPVMTSLAAWPHLRSLSVITPVIVDLGMGASLAQLTGLHSLSLTLAAAFHQLGGFAEGTMHAVHLRQLTPGHRHHE